MQVARFLLYVNNMCTFNIVQIRFTEMGMCEGHLQYSVLIKDKTTLTLLKIQPQD